MSNISTLSVRLEAQTAAFDRAMSKSKSGMERITATAAKTAKIVAGIGVAATSAFTTFGVIGVREVNRVAGEIDAMYKQASNLRLDLGDFQRLGFIAEQSGNSIEQLGGAINIMNRSLAQETKLTTDALNGIGLSISQVMAMDPGRRFEAIATAIKNTGDEAAQTRAQVALFGRSGGNMLNLLNADFDALNEQFDRMGITLTNAQGDMVAAYQDAKNRLSTMATGFKQQFTAQVAGPLTRVTELIEEMALELGGMDQLANRAAIAVVNGVGSMIDAMSMLLTTIQNVGRAWHAMMGTGRTFGSYLSRSVESVAGAFGMDTLQGNAQMLGDAFKSTADDAWENLMAANENMEETSKAQARIDKLITDLVNSIGAEAPDSIKELQDSASDASNRLDNLFNEESKNTDAWNKIFGPGPDNQGPVRDFIPEAFAKAARAFSDSLTTGNMTTRDVAMSDMQRLIEVASGRQGSTSFAGPDLQRSGDITGMQSVLDRLQSMAGGDTDNAQPIVNGLIDVETAISTQMDKLLSDNAGLFSTSHDYFSRMVEEMSNRDEVSVKLDLRTDAGNLVGKVTGSREFAQAVQTLAAQAVNNTARGVAA